MKLKAFIGFALLCLGAGAAWAADSLNGSKVLEIKFVGNQTLTEKTLMAVVRQKLGESLDPDLVNDDVKRLWAMRVFTDVQASAEPMAGGARLVFELRERAKVKELRFFGNKEISDGSLKEKAGIEPETNYDPAKAAEAAKAMVDLYKDKDYYAAQVTYEAKPADEDGKVNVIFNVVEGVRMRLEKIEVIGAKVYDPAKITGQMKDTKEKGWFTGGSYDPIKLGDDLEAVLRFYAKGGYTRAKIEGYELDQWAEHSREVVRKITEFDDKAKRIVVRFHIDEGKKYALKAIKIEGQSVLSESELREKIDSKTGVAFDRSKFDRDVSRIQEAYSKMGYVYAGVTPRLAWDEDRGEVTATLDISEGGKAYVEAIKIRGNDVTKEKVIRRQIKIKEGDPFDADLINRSRMNIYNLGFFENVGLETQPGSEVDKLNLIFDVSPERKTGTLSVGAGYSSVEGLVGFLQVAQNNLFGNGQSVSAQWDFGDRKKSYSLSFTEPYLFDNPVSFGTDIYNIQRFSSYNSQGFDQESVGGSLRLGYNFDDIWRTFLTYRYQSDNTSNIQPGLVGITAGIENISSITPSLSRDTRDNIFDASRGSYNVLSVTLAGTYLGGDRHFWKPVFDSRLHYSTPPLFGMRWLKNFVLGLHGRVGWAGAFESAVQGVPSIVPVSERFFMGGTDSVRGYFDRNLGASRLGGGLFMMQGNVEYGFKPAPPLKLRAFYDVGNSFTNFDAVDWQRPAMYDSVGFGMLFTIPTSVIQIRLDWGWALVPDERPRDGRIHFNIGNIF